MKRSHAKALLVQNFQIEPKLAGQILDFIERDLGMHPPTVKVRSWTTHLLEEWEDEKNDEKEL